MRGLKGIVTDDPCVQVRTWLRPSTFRQLTGHAVNRGLTLDQLLSKLADASLRPTEIPPERTSTSALARRKPRRSLTVDEWARAQDMRDAGYSLDVIARQFDVSAAAVCRNTTRAA